MVKADTLDYESVFDSLKRKEIYASWGPEITDIRFDPTGLRLLVESPDAVSVYLSTERRDAEAMHRMPEWKTGLFEFDLSDYIRASLEYSSDMTPYVRVTLTDAQGRKAFSRAYRVRELLEM